MDDNIIKTKICKCCGKELPLEQFKTCRGGIRKHTTCISCEQQAAGVSDKFKNFTARELIEELRARGYKGELTLTRIEKVKI